MEEDPPGFRRVYFAMLHAHSGYKVLEHPQEVRLYEGPEGGLWARVTRFRDDDKGGSITRFDLVRLDGPGGPSKAEEPDRPEGPFLTGDSRADIEAASSWGRLNAAPPHPGKARAPHVHAILGLLGPPFAAGGPAQILDVWMAGGVERWHANPNRALRRAGDSNASHAGRAVLLAMALFPHSPRVWKVAAGHDLGESGVAGGPGDVSGRAKQEHPELREGACDAEQGALERLGLWEFLGTITPWELAAGKVVDDLDAYLVMLEVAPGDRHAFGWPEHRKRLKVNARLTTTWAEVRQVIRLARKRFHCSEK